MINDFGEAVLYYDKICAGRGKDYESESRTVIEIIRQRRPEAKSLLDVACGTGGHLIHSKHHFSTYGIDKDRKMLDVAQDRCPDVPLFQCNMLDFNLQRTFDAIMCMYGSISYLQDAAQLQAALRGFRKHVLPGGILIVEPFVSPDAYRVHDVAMITSDQPELKITRMHVSAREGNLAVLDHHFLIAEPSGVRYFVERQKLVLFTKDEFVRAFESAGFRFEHLRHHVFRHGLFVGTAT